MIRGEVMVIMMALGHPDKSTLLSQNWHKNKVTLGRLDGRLYFDAYKSEYLTALMDNVQPTYIQKGLITYEATDDAIKWVAERYDGLKERNWI